MTEDLPSRSSFTSLAAFSPSSLRFLSIILDLSAAALSSWLTVQPMVPSARFRTAAWWENITREKKKQLIDGRVLKKTPYVKKRRLKLSKATSLFDECQETWRSPFIRERERLSLKKTDGFSVRCELGLVMDEKTQKRHVGCSVSHWRFPVIVKKLSSDWGEGGKNAF